MRCIITLLVCFLLYVILGLIAELIDSEKCKNIKKLKTGMSAINVRKFLGHPKGCSSYNYGETKEYHYRFNRMASHINLYVYFDRHWRLTHINLFEHSDF